MGRYTNDYLESLYRLARDEGWEVLTPAEQRALGRWCRKSGKPIPDGNASVPTKDDRTADGEKRESETPQPFRTGSPSGSNPATKPMPEGMEYVGADWPADAAYSAPTRRKWQPVAAALKDLHGGVALVQSGMRRERARDLATRIRTGHLKSFSPRGAFEARYMPKDGKYAVLARYVGKES